ncbi:hypothetical protein V9T40_004938 [Parthenolecanium corni]|uniref:NADH dehydrogenase [ubiquinone] 1 beta subcomplex subunit 9 n=1 Tax=Parthenolecanium corni TaxID=536013 RepID=A0AAN9TFD7_9HEMI
MAYCPVEFVTHTMKVKRLYKQVIRDIQAWHTFRHDFRVQAVLMRQKFEENRHIKDPIKAKQILEEATEKFEYIRHPDPILFPSSYGAPAWDRTDVAKSHDAVLDGWHPLEREQYPDYFARREQRKKEFVEWYDKTYGRPPYERVD